VTRTVNGQLVSCDVGYLLSESLGHNSGSDESQKENVEEMRMEEWKPRVDRQDSKYFWLLGYIAGATTTPMLRYYVVED